jgi:hypothetical protein
VAKSARLEGALHVALDPEHALHLFTPVGERLWVNGWEPRFPAGERGDGTETGTVWLTAAEGRETVWSVVDRDERAVRYSRSTPGFWAGLVEVSVDLAEGGGSRVTVVYRLTALSAEGEAALDDFAAAYDDFIAEWERLVATHADRA